MIVDIDRKPRIFHKNPGLSPKTMSSERRTPAPKIEIGPAILAFLMLAGALSLWTYAVFWRHPSVHVPGSYLYSGLPLDPLKANAQFQNRAATAFPLGSPEEAMIKVLKKQGFFDDRWFNSKAKRMTRRSSFGSRSYCQSAATIWWKVDAQKRVRDLTSRFLRSPMCTNVY